MLLRGMLFAKRRQLRQLHREREKEKRKIRLLSRTGLVKTKCGTLGGRKTTGRSWALILLRKVQSSG